VNFKKNDGGACFDELSMNGFMSTFSSQFPFVLSLSKDSNEIYRNRD